MNVYDVAIVGSGPAGLFAAYKLSKVKQGLKILIVDQGADLEQRVETSQKNSVKPYGFGGSGLFSDCKIIFSKVTGGRLNEIIDDEKLDKYLLETKSLWIEFIGDLEIDDFTNLSSHKLVKQAKDLGLELIVSDTLHIGSDLSPIVLGKIKDFLVQNNVEIIMNTKIENIVPPARRNIINNYILHKKDYFSLQSLAGPIFNAKRVILAPGRGGAKWLSEQANKLGIKSTNGICDLGLRIEVPFAVTKHLTDELYEFKLKYKTPSYNDDVRTFCCNAQGFVVEEQHKDITLVNGYSNKNIKSDNTNFAFLSSIKLTEPVNNSLEFIENVAKTVNSIANGVMVQRLGDLIDHRRTKTLVGNNVVPTLDCFAGDISLAFPYRFLVNIIEGLQGIDKIAPGIFDDDTLLYSPELKLYSNVIQIDKNMMTDVDSLYTIADGSGWTKGIAQSCASGLLAADAIISRG